MKKLLFYINSIRHGGAERVIVNLANRFSEESYEIIFVTSFKSNNEYLLNKDIKRITLDNNDFSANFFSKNINRTLKLRKIMKRENPDVAISFMAEANFRTITAAKLLKVKTLISVRNDPNKEYPNLLFKFLAKFLYRSASGCVFQTEDAQKWFPNKVRKNSKIILNQVDEKFFETEAGEKKKDIVTVGRLEHQKNHKLLLKSFAAISKKFPDENLVIYGEGSQKKSLMNYSKALGINKRVSFMGATKEIHEKIKSAKVFILSSDYEGLPNVLMEAMTLGIPVVSTDCPSGGPKVLIKNGHDGILVKVGDDKQLSNAISTILMDPSIASKFGRNAIIKSKEFHPDIIFKEWENYLLTLKKI